MSSFWIPKDPPWFSLLARFDPVLSSGRDAQISRVSLFPSAHHCFPVALFATLNFSVHNCCFFLLLYENSVEFKREK